MQGRIDVFFKSVSFAVVMGFSPHCNTVRAVACAQTAQENGTEAKSFLQVCLCRDQYM